MTFPIRIDVHSLAYANFKISAVTPDWVDIRAVRVWELAEGAHRLLFDSSAVDFTVTAAGKIEYDPALETYVRGFGTPGLEVTGYPVTVDATALADATVLFRLKTA
ncbi:MAG TPA: hypothetical protein PKD88_10360 [Nitrosomonas sp.]|nr:hypothetical protein [Nitrosomonas sp.]HMW21398.1 hypothetical protein [Nitrosomonas sp.]HMW69269.1 hypothetical protein [Nitrosomonas sp.]HMY62350.1 hypothetical protein [Nitrosomonas sp.]HMY90923.1 hypothetical protein [Nitrosomonas sp.]